MAIGSAEANGQVLRGRVSDVTSNEPLPAATVQIAGTFQGTITNSYGLYAIEVNHLPVDLVVRYIGYRTDTLTVDGLDSIEFKLEPVGFEMDQMVITDEDPAVWIMRQVIEKKQQWQQKLKTLEVEAYGRITYSNDTGIVAIKESGATVWWDHERGHRGKITMNKKTGNLPSADAIPVGGLFTNLYNDNIRTAGHTLIGITHPDALDHYNFTLKGTRRVDDVIVYDIEVGTKNVYTSGFLGRVSVLDGEFALIEAQLRPGPAFLFPYPIQVSEVAYQQQFSNYSGEVWLPTDLRTQVALDISIGPLLTIPTIDMRMVTRLTDYQLNVTLPDSVFENEQYFVVDSLAIASGDTFEREGTIVPLTPEESIAYASIDSTDTLEKAYAPTGAMSQLIPSDGNRPAILRALSAISFPTIAPYIWYNRVDAFHGGLEVGTEIGDALDLRLQGGLSTGQRGASRITYKGSARYQKGWFVDVEYHAENAPTYISDARRPLLNSALMLLGQMDYFDYYRREGITGTAGYQLGWRSATISGTFLHESHRSLTGNVSYDLFGNSEPQRLNPLIPEGDLQSVKVEFSFGQKSNHLQFGPQRYLKSSVEITTPGSEFTFTRYYLNAGWRINTLLKRRLIPATLDFGFSVGLASDGGRELPPQRSFIVEGGIAAYHWGGALYTLRGLPYRGNGIVFGHWEHNFRTLPFEVLGMRSFVNNGLSIIAFGGHAFIRGAQRANNDWIRHNELGVSVSGILGIIRVNLAYRLGENIVNPSFSVARIF